VQEPGPQEPRRPRRVGLLFGIAAAVFVVDVITKIIVVATLTPEHQVKVIGSLSPWTWCSSEAAFSFGPSMTILFTLTRWA
jgi:signal peptidase II